MCWQVSVSEMCHLHSRVIFKVSCYITAWQCLTRVCLQSSNEMCYFPLPTLNRRIETTRSARHCDNESKSRVSFLSANLFSSQISVTLSFMAHFFLFQFWTETCSLKDKTFLPVKTVTKKLSWWRSKSSNVLKTQDTYLLFTFEESRSRKVKI